MKTKTKYLPLKTPFSSKANKRPWWIVWKRWKFWGAYNPHSWSRGKETRMHNVMISVSKLLSDRIPSFMDVSSISQFTKVPNENFWRHSSRKEKCKEKKPMKYLVCWCTEWISNTDLIKQNPVCIQVMINFPVLWVAMIKCLSNIICNSHPHFPWQWLFFPYKEFSQVPKKYWDRRSNYKPISKHFKWHEDI